MSIPFLIYNLYNVRAFLKSACAVVAGYNLDLMFYS